MLSWHMPQSPESLSNLATYNYQNNALVSVFTHPVELDQLPSAPALPLPLLPPFSFLLRDTAACFQVVAALFNSRVS